MDCRGTGGADGRESKELHRGCHRVGRKLSAARACSRAWNFLKLAQFLLAHLSGGNLAEELRCQRN